MTADQAADLRRRLETLRIIALRDLGQGEGIDAGLLALIANAGAALVAFDEVEAELVDDA